MFLKKKRNNRKDRRTALCTLRTCLFLSSIILVWGSTYPTHLRRLVLLQNRIVRVIKKKGFDAHTEPLFKNLMILKLEDIYSLHLGKFMFSFLYVTEKFSVFSLICFVHFPALTIVIRIKH